MKCPICGEKGSKKFSVKTREAKACRKLDLCKCPSCRVIFAEDYAKDRSHLYDSKYAAWGGEGEEKEKEISKSKKKAFQRQLTEVLKITSPEGKKLLDIGTGPGYLLECAKKVGFEVWGTEISRESGGAAEKKFPGKIYFGKLSGAKYPKNHFDVVAMTDVLEHLCDPHETVAEVERILKPGGHLLIISPNSQSLTRKILGRNWFQYKYEHVLYFNKKSLEYLLERHNFSVVFFKNNVKDFFVSYYEYYFEKYTIPVVGSFCKIIFPLLPKKIKNIHLPIPITGEFIAIAKKNDSN